MTAVIEAGQATLRVGTETRPRRFHDHVIRDWQFVNGEAVEVGRWDTRPWTADEIDRWTAADRWYRSVRGRLVRAAAWLVRPVATAPLYDDPFDYDDEGDYRIPARGFWPAVARRLPLLRATAELIDAAARRPSDGHVTVMNCALRNAPVVELSA